MSLELCANDRSFGPGAHCRELDFTLSFQAIVLSLFPDCVFLLYASLRILLLRNQTTKLIRPGWALLAPKAILCLLLLSSDGAAMVLQFLKLRHQGWPTVSLAASVVSFGTAFILTILVICEHFKSLAPSTLVICYSGLLKGLFGSVTLRTGMQIHLSDTERPLFIATALATSAYFALALVELVEKRYLLEDAYKGYPFQATSSVLSRVLYLGFLPTLWKGRTTKLTLDDLTSIPDEQKVASARRRLEDALKSTKPGPTYLFRATMKAFGISFLSPIIPRFILMLATTAQPLLLNSMVTFVSSSEPDSRGWAIVGGYACVYTTIAVCTALYWEKVYNITVQYRAALVGTIYQKTLRLASHEARVVGSGAASTYMSVDVERIGQGLEWTHELWASICSIILAIAVLYEQATWTAFLPIAVLVCILGLTSIIAGDVGAQQGKWMKATDKRIKFISSIINNFRSMKWAAYETYMERDATALRTAEVNEGKNFCNLVVVLSSLSTGASQACITVTLAAYAILAAHGHGNGPLDATRIFSITSAITLLSVPVNFIGQDLPMILAAYASLKRIQDFLQLEEKDANNETDEKVADVPEKSLLSLHGSFAWTKETNVLHDINLHLPVDQLTVCVGPVASGKTTLLMTLLGETIPNKGLGGRIAYASQDAFIFSGTVRENILCGAPMNDELYSKVLLACALTPDLRRLTHGDQTQLGDKGLTLSGGQKQRIGLARAVYAQAPITLLDDPFSALDSETEGYVSAALFGPDGLLTGRSVVLVTHNVSYVASASWVVVLKNGRVAYEGVPSQLQDLSEMEAACSHVQLHKSVEAADLTKEEEAIEDDEKTTEFASRGWGPYLFLLRSSGWYQVVIAVAFLFLWRGLVFSSQGFLKEWSESNGRHFQAWISGYAAFTVLGFLFSLVSLKYYLRGMTLTNCRNIHKAELGGLLDSPPSIVLTILPGRLINRFSQDIYTLDFPLPVSMVNTVLTFLGVVGTVILLIIPAPYVAILIPPLGIVYTIILKFYLRTSKQLQALEAASKSPLYKVFGTTLGGLETIRAFSAQSYFEKQNDFHLDQSQGPYYFRFMGQAFLGTALAAITMLVSVTLAVIAVALRHTTNASLLGIALSNLTGLTFSLSTLLSSWALVENGTVALQRIQEIVNLPPEETSKGDTIVLPEKKGWPMQGSIVFDDFQMKYREDLPTILRNISFSLRGGQKLGICGRTGSGKSSMLLSLFRACPLTEGKIIIDGVDISTLNLQSLRSALSVVSQDPFLWHASVRDNLDVERQLSDEALWSALRRVGMSEAVSEFPQKLDMLLEDGSLSRGQRQLLCMARVLLRERQIVILDEATSSMDLETDQRIREIIKTDLSDRTIIAVAHRIATICDSDYVMVLDDGKIVEYGPPQELLRDADSKFAALAASQGIKSN